MSQVNFFQVEADESAFLDYLAGRGDTAFLLGRFFDTPTPAYVSREALPAEFGQRRIGLVHKGLRPRLVLTARGGGDYEGLYLRDMRAEPVIDLDRCGYREGALQRGRIYAKAGWLPDAAEAKEYARWYRSISGWLKRRYTRVGGYRWFGPAALAYAQSGGATSPAFEVIKASTHRP